MAPEEAKHFKLSEFACRCGCGRCRVSAELVKKLDAARELYGKPMTVSSGFRCESHNRKVGGKPDSAHTRGEAADLTFQSGAEMFAALNALLQAGLTRVGIGNHFIHVDVSTDLPRPALWGYGG